MKLADLLSEYYAAEFDESWERERTATLVRVFAVRLHATRCSLRETQAILRLIGIERSHQVIWHWIHKLADSVTDPSTFTRAFALVQPIRTLCVLRTAKPSRVAVDETAVKINGD